MTVDKRSYTEKEASLYINMSRSYLRQARMEGNREVRTSAPRFIKIGRAVRYLREDLDAWLDSFMKQTHLYQTK